MKSLIAIQKIVWLSKKLGDDTWEIMMWPENCGAMLPGEGSVSVMLMESGGSSPPSETLLNFQAIIF